MLLVLVLQDLLTDAEAAIRAKDYKQAIKLYDQAEKEGKLTAVGTYFRATAYYQLGMAREAIRDYASAVKQLPQNNKARRRSQDNLFELCYSNCYLNCTKSYSSSQFASYQHYYALQALGKQRKQFLHMNDPDTEELKKFGKKCTHDPDIQQKLLASLVASNDFSGAREVAERLKVVFAARRAEATQLADVYELLQYAESGNYTGIERAAQRAARSQPDEAVFSQFYRMGKALRELSAEIQEYTPSAQISHDKADSNAKKVYKLQKLPQRIFGQVGKRIQALTAQVFAIDAGFVREVDCIALQYKLERQISGFLDILDIMSGKQNQIALDDLQADTAIQKYVKALLFYNDVDQQLKQIIYAYYQKADIADKVDAADKRVNLIYTLLREAWAQKDSDDSFPQMKKFIEDLNKLADQVHAYHMKVLNPDLYKVLGVSRYASEGDIRKAYFKLARKYHPDMVPQNTSEDEKKRLSREFQRIADAYDTLVDPAKRNEYNYGQHNAAERQSAEQYHAQRKQLAYQMFMRGQDFGGYQFYQFGQQFDFGGFDPFYFFNFGGFGDQGHGQQGQQGQRQRVVFNFNGQQFFM